MVRPVDPLVLHAGLRRVPSKSGYCSPERVRVQTTQSGGLGDEL